jgi:hypothetical protein
MRDSPQRSAVNFPWLAAHGSASAAGANNGVVARGSHFVDASANFGAIGRVLVAWILRIEGRGLDWAAY